MNLAGLTLLLLLLSDPFVAGTNRVATPGERTPETVSLIRLIASPGVFEGKAVRVAGFCSLAFESEALYLHEDDYRHRLAPNSLRLGPGSAINGRKQVNGRYCIVEATFRANDAGQSSLRSGRLVDIATLEAIPPYDRR